MLRAKETFFWGDSKRQKHIVEAGDLVDEKDPAVKGRERFFEKAAPKKRAPKKAVAEG